MPQEGIKALSTDKKNTEEGTLVLPQEPTVIYGAAKAKLLEPGVKYEVHKIQADKLVKKGEATFDELKKA